MSELRQNRLTGEWVIIAPTRNLRPVDTAVSPIPEPAYEEGCPFCPGNEEQIPPIILEMNTVAHPWQTRVIPNKFPALVSAPAVSGDPHSRPGYGRHEVIIDSPHHHVDFADMSIAELDLVLATYVRRYHEIRSEDGNLLPILFRNRGARAGASLHHPHSQLVALPLAPSKIRDEERAALDFFEANGRCAYCDELARELDSATRIVFENEYFVAYVPYAATAPHEVLVVPRTHRADFGDIPETEQSSLAAALISIFGGMRSTLGLADYNLLVRSSADYRSQARHLHWYIRIVPKVGQPGGFEVATGIAINPSRPEDDANRLRSAAA